MIIIFVIPNSCLHFMSLNYNQQQNLKFFFHIQRTKWIQVQPENHAPDIIFNETATTNLWQKSIVYLITFLTFFIPCNFRSSTQLITFQYNIFKNNKKSKHAIW